MPNWKKLIVSGSDAVLNKLTVTNGITGSLFGTASWATNALTASFISSLRAAGSTTQVQINKDGLLYADSGFIYDSSSATVVITGKSGNPYPLQVTAFGSDGVFLGSDNGTKAGLYSLNSDQTIATYDHVTGVYSYSNGFYRADGGTLYHMFTGSVYISSSAYVDSILYVTNSVRTNTVLGLAGTGTIAKLDSSIYYYSNENYNFNNIINVHSFTGSVVFTTGITGSLFGTSSWAQSASIAINAQTASFLPAGTYSITSSQALTASYTPNALITASVSSNVLTFTKGNGTTFNLTVDTGSGGGSTSPGGNQFDVQVNDGGGAFTGDQYFQYRYQDQKIVIANTLDATNTPLDNTNYYTTERYNTANNIQVDTTNYQFTNAQFPYSKYVTDNSTTAIILIATNAGTGVGPGLTVHAFKCDYTLVSLSNLDTMVLGTRTGTLYCAWDEDKATYANPVITDTAVTSDGGLVDKLEDAVFTVAWQSANIELSLDTNPSNTNIIFNGLFTIFSMRT